MVQIQIQTQGPDLLISYVTIFSSIFVHTPDQEYLHIKCVKPEICTKMYKDCTKYVVVVLLFFFFLVAILNFKGILF